MNTDGNKLAGFEGRVHWRYDHAAALLLWPKMLNKGKEAYIYIYINKTHLLVSRRFLQLQMQEIGRFP